MSDDGDGVTQEAVSALLERHNLPTLQSMEQLAEGGQGTWLLNGEMVLRIDRREAPSPALAKEASIFRRLRRSTDVPCPEVLALDTSRELVPYDALVQSHVAGFDGATIWDGLDEAAREALSEEAGRMIGAVHGLHWRAYGDFDAESGTFGHYPHWIDKLLVRLERAAEQAMAHAALPQPLIDAVVTEVNDGDALLQNASRPVLVHTRLQPKNMLFEQRGNSWRVAAILNWGHSVTADAAWEFAHLGLYRSEASLDGDAFIYGYRERHELQQDLRSRIYLYRLALHLEGAALSDAEALNRRPRHLQSLQRLLQKPGVSG